MGMMNNGQLKSLLAFAIALIGTFAGRVDAQEQVPSDATRSVSTLNQLTSMLNSIDAYHPTDSLKGKATLAGSVTMLHLGQEWAAHFKKFHSGVEFTRGDIGSDAALKMLQKDATVIAGIPRMITNEDVAQLKAGACKEPCVIVVAIEPIVVMVNNANPVEMLTDVQVQKLLANGSNMKWSDVGVQGEFGGKAVRIHSNNDNNETQTFVKYTVMNGQESAKPAALHRSYSELLQTLSQDPAGMAIGPMTDTPGLKAVALSVNGSVVEPSEMAVLAGQYPLIRPMTLVFDKSMLSQDGGLRREIINYVLSRDGQSILLREGFFPINPNFIAQQIAQISGPQLR